MSIKNYFLKDQQPLRPDNAVAAIVKNSSNDYLLQLSDLVNGIFYPMSVSSVKYENMQDHNKA